MPISKSTAATAGRLCPACCHETPITAAIMKKDLAIFEGHGIRRRYDEKTGTWWFSVVDIIHC